MALAPVPFGARRRVLFVHGMAVWPFGARWGALFVHGEAFRPFRYTLRWRFCARRGDATAPVHAGGAFAGEIKKCDIYNLIHIILMI